MRKSALLVAVLMAILWNACAVLQAAETPAAGKIDYVAKLNELAKAGKAPEDNAAPFYEKAFELAVLEPNELTRDELKAVASAA